ncbi:TPA: phage receptor [Escherichia coli]
MSEGPGGPQGATAGGTLAMRMLSQQAMVASQMKRAANDKAIAQMLAAKKSGPPAARLGDEIQHKSFLGALAGAVLGAIVTIAEGCLIMAACATGPYALVLLPALMYASYKASDYVEEKQNQLESWINSFCDTDGAINTGSENVNINGKPAARAAVTLPPPPPPGAIPEVPQGEPSWGDIATDLLESAAEKAVPLAKAWGNAVITLTDSNAGFMDRVSAGASLLFPAGPVLMEFATMVGGRGEIKKDVDFPEAGEDTALCDKENKPPRIAQGSSNVFINNQPAARKGDKLECSAAIVEGSPDVFIGGEQVTYLDIQLEFPPWQRMILGGITIASYLLPPAGLLGKLGNLARLGKLGNLLGKSGKLLGAKLGALLGKTGKSLKSIANKVIRWVTDPVDPVTGAYCDERTDFTLGQTLPLSFTRFHSSVLPLHGLTGVGWSDSWSEYAWVREQGNRVDIITQGATLRFAFDGDSDTAVNPYHAQYILRRRDDYLELFDRDALSSRFFYDAFPGMRLRHPVTDDTSDDRLAHSPGDRMYMLGGMSDTASNRITFERDSQYRITGVSHTDGIRLKLTYHASGYPRMSYRELYKPDEKPLAIMVPAWNETGVIGNMAELAATTLDYENYHIFVGTYPNDPDTQRDVDEVCARFPNVHKVVCARPGPTSKADCLNNVLDAITQFERSANFAFAGFILHDAEDVISPMELRLFNYLVERKDLIQIPVYPFEREWTHFTSMTYIDEFSELHGKDVPVREALAGQVPSAGVGTCFSRRAVTALLADGDGIAFDVQSLTEDYDIGFRYIHQQVPDNIPLTLYLAEAYRHFGHDDRARLLLEDQLKRHPGDARLERSLAAIPVEVKSVTTVEELLAQQKACDAAPTLRCRSEVGQNALRLAQLPVARAQLNDATFAASPEGKTLRTDLLQRAIYLKQWSQADTLYNEARQQNTLSAAERRQWFDVLLAGQLDDRILALQSQGIFTDPQSYITYATALAYRGEKARLQHYLIENKPLFTTDAQEKSWLYLLSKYSANPVQALANYTVQFADNRQYVVGATLPVLLKEGQYDAAQKLLATLPANEMLEERYAVSVATRNKAESLRLVRLLYQQEPANLTRLDQLTWQLMQNEQSREAADLLLQRYPFQGDARVSQTLMARLASLLESHPYLATPAKVAILSKPLPLAAQRQWQSQLPGIADNCPAIVRLLGDMSPSYDAAAWNRLAKCYRDTLPGVALYAWLQAEQRQPNAWQHRAVAYQAYQVEDYATALAAWQKISLHDMSNEDLLAAANTAQAAGNGAARDRWLQQAEQRGLGNNALYWWLHAQRYIPGQPELALSDLTRSINIAPSANAYVARATIYRQRHNVPAAVSDLRAALELEPNNSNIQAALGYALWDSGDIAQSREMLEQAHKGLPDDPALIRQLAYVNQRLDDMPATQHYARLVIDDIDNQALITPLTPEQNQQRFNFRRLHEEVGRRWTFSFDSSIGLRSGAMSTANNNVGGAAPGKSYRSYGQLEAEYRIGRNMLLEGDLLSVYSRVFADTGENGVMMPVKNPMSGTGLRWKPLRDQIFFLAVEQQLPLNGQNGASDTMLRASASFFNGGKYSDEWHPNGSGWFAQNLYLDAAQYIRQDIQAWTADYRVSWHQKVANGQTIEPYAHVQDNGYRDKGTQGAQLGGVGVRWNIWTGETHYDAWPHKVSLGVEYQHTFKAINQRNGERNNAFLTIGVHW